MNNRSYLLVVCAAGVALAVASIVLGQAPTNAALKNPAALKEMAPPEFKVNFDTSAGIFEVEVHRDWAPNGTDRFYNLVKNGFFDNARFFRVISGFMVQFGLNGDPAVNAVWREARIPRDPVKEGNKRRNITFAMQGGSNGPDTRTTQVFINFRDNSNLDPLGFAAFGRVKKVWMRSTRSILVMVRARRAAQGRNKAASKQKATRI